MVTYGGLLLLVENVGGTYNPLEVVPQLLESALSKKGRIRWYQK